MPALTYLQEPAPYAKVTLHVRDIFSFRGSQDGDFVNMAEMVATNVSLHSPTMNEVRRWIGRPESDFPPDLEVGRLNGVKGVFYRPIKPVNEVLAEIHKAGIGTGEVDVELLKEYLTKYALLNWKHRRAVMVELHRDWGYCIDHGTLRKAKILSTVKDAIETFLKDGQY